MKGGKQRIYASVDPAANIHMDNQDNKKIIMEYEKKQAALEAQLEQKEEEIKSYKLKLNSQKKDKIISDALRIDEKDKQEEMINKLKRNSQTEV